MACARPEPCLSRATRSNALVKCFCVRAWPLFVWSVVGLPLQEIGARRTAVALSVCSYNPRVGIARVFSIRLRVDERVASLFWIEASSPLTLTKFDAIAIASLSQVAAPGQSRDCLCELPLRTAFANCLCELPLCSTAFVYKQGFDQNFLRVRFLSLLGHLCLL